MRESIKKIIEIDREAERYREKNKAIIQKEKEVFEEELGKLKSDFEKSLQQEIKREQKQIADKTAVKVTEIQTEKKHNLIDMEKRFGENENELVRRLFSEFIENMKG